jgi:hypothetical protein
VIFDGRREQPWPNAPRPRFTGDDADAQSSPNLDAVETARRHDVRMESSNLGRGVPSDLAQHSRVPTYVERVAMLFVALFGLALAALLIARSFA